MAASDPTTPKPQRPGRGPLPKALAVVGAATALVFAISITSLLLFARGARAPTTRELVIPEGTAAAVARGSDPFSIPASLSFVAGDVLVVRNQDLVAHRIGPLVIPPGQARRLDLRPTPVNSFICTVHPGGSLALDVQPRGLDLRLVLFPTLALGPALGAVVALVWRVAARLAVPPGSH